MNAHQTTVDGDALLGAVARGPGPLQPLRARQVHKVELGAEGFKLGTPWGAGQTVVCLVLLVVGHRPAEALGLCLLIKFCIGLVRSRCNAS